MRNNCRLTLFPLKQQDYQRIAQIQREIEQMLDEEEEIFTFTA